MSSTKTGWHICNSRPTAALISTILLAVCLRDFVVGGVAFPKCPRMQVECSANSICRFVCQCRHTTRKGGARCCNLLFDRLAAGLANVNKERGGAKDG
ncbi:hypothetical protein GALMADRAFT_559327 [Galerina marginata CBS 339.88]|uniref:Uncharacterized protein n=1 Tax=Galerina marginata (strain CBS 339.88) TaxID=685588 RepID=A0A067SUS7_GALM3|nr:hypothetical protein GALMADRAFT_559327 [Galerina marginata CBS 339.88]